MKKTVVTKPKKLSIAALELKSEYEGTINKLGTEFNDMKDLTIDIFLSFISLDR